MMKEDSQMFNCWKFQQSDLFNCSFVAGQESITTGKKHWTMHSHWRQSSNEEKNGFSLSCLASWFIGWFFATVLTTVANCLAFTKWKQWFNFSNLWWHKHVAAVLLQLSANTRWHNKQIMDNKDVWPQKMKENDENSGMHFHSLLHEFHTTILGMSVAVLWKDFKVA